MTTYLLEIHIGPMQVFIAAARRTRDLWFGSWLMSELSKAAARGVAEAAGEDNLIFPAMSLANLQPGSDLSVANKIVALVADPENVVKKADAALRARLDELGKIALDGAGGPLNTRETAVAQIKDLPEFYCVAVPLPDEKDYAKVRKKAENLLAARKNLRDFEQPTWASNRPKSSLDGNRESVIPEEVDDEKVSGDAKKMYKWYKAKAGEQLSGVDLLKRLGKRSKSAWFESFPSTSHMAVMPLRTHLQAKASDSVTLGKWQDYLKALRKNNPDIEKHEVVRHGLQLPILGNLDGGLLFKSRLLDYMDKVSAHEVESELNAFLKALLRDAQVKELIPYYALLVGDGDFMGKTINNLETSQAHRNFSKKLAGFAKEAQTIVAEHEGAAVFTGGDDVLALLPIHQAIQCAAKLAEEFQTTMQRFTDKNGRSPTFSAGIAIFHHTEPLEDALQTARDAEQAAKLVKDKNALAVTEAKRSGAPRTVKGKWGEVDERLLALAAFFQANALPAGLAYQLRDMYLHLGGAEGMKSQPDLQDVLKKEAGRIIKRKEGATKEQAEAAQAYVAEMVSLLSKDYTIEQIAHELIIAANLAKAADQADVPLPLPELEKERG